MSVKFQGSDVAGLLGVDTFPISGSTKAVTSGGVYSALAGKQPVLTAGDITTGYVADGAITLNKLEDSSVSTAKIANGAVTTEKIAPGAVTSDKLASNAITTSNIATGSITADKLASGAIFYVGTTAPSNTNILWIDTNNGLKYYNGSSWVTVPVAYNE